MECSKASIGVRRPWEDRAVENRRPEDETTDRALDFFRRMVESVGVKRFAHSLGLSTRQVNRILAGAQPNPVNRLLRSLQACCPEEGDAALDYICQEMGGYFVREEGALDNAAVNAVRECAEAIAAISDGRISSVDEKEIREAITALISLSRAVQEQRRQDGRKDPGLEISVRTNVTHDGHVTDHRRR